MNEAHKGLIKDPAEYVKSGDTYKNSCSDAGCHEQLANDFKSSMHQQLWGEKKWIALRSGKENFSSCPAEVQDSFDGDCRSCHATCGDCHVSIPNSAGRGLNRNHAFGKPKTEDNCMACHGSRISEDMKKEGIHKGDIHFVELLMNCSDCHSTEEMHSAVTEENTDRYHYDKLPGCEQGCHRAEAVDSLNVINLYHTMHYEKLSCFVCHSQNYNNCTGCHVNGTWKTDDVYQNRNPMRDFKIGLNPLPEKGPKFSLLRHVPVSRDSYSEWDVGINTLTDYDKYPTWKYTSPHSVQRFTGRTNKYYTNSGNCSNNCHIGTDDKNKNLYLFREYISNNADNADWADEEAANSDVYVDGELPSWWGK